VRLRIEGKSRLEVVVKLVCYSALYGLIPINWVDLFPPRMPAYHLWLITMYFMPFITVMLLLGFDDWELMISLGLLTSLMNDLFYYPIGNLFFNTNVDLLEWYRFQLGLRGFEHRWTFDGGFIRFQVTSILMGSSIYLRIIVIAALLWKWWREASRIINDNEKRYCMDWMPLKFC